MNLELAPYDIHNAPGIEEFLENFAARDLKYYASDIFTHSKNEVDINKAINKAMSACRTLKIPVGDHFKIIYKSKDESVFLDWKLSKFGCLLTLLNGDPQNSEVARFQLRLIQLYMNNN